MPNKELDKLSKKLDNKFKLIDKIDKDNEIELKAEYSKYLCVLVSGYFENTIKVIFEGYTKDKGHPNLNRYITKQIRNKTNFNSQKLKNFLKEFNDEWENEYEDVVDDDEKDAIGSIYVNRNNIAHGKDNNISFAAVKSYYEHVKKLVCKINQIVNCS
ncbi:MAG: HEPN domain-containing protein [Anaeromicrobium sp.]|jgi:hypothetical protein|uniref:HEPN domain-containing protein n=1 Tax=Anaeromicrobium sp. TaxID=1929132 RepID=UPI0025E4C0BC|nr:HEPN domain-containing protein [Anaeromicrobium sp.]MCT4593534.1 HEPN domain-containing protein [Anaeromicrobium sp.]